MEALTSRCSKPSLISLTLPVDSGGAATRRSRDIRARPTSRTTISTLFLTSSFSNSKPSSLLLVARLTVKLVVFLPYLRSTIIAIVLSLAVCSFYLTRHTQPVLRVSLRCRRRCLIASVCYNCCSPSRRDNF